ncbi:molybdenum cofactor guanylyltransferase MobA [Emcibacter sp. SYSU 3D8]|uniref:molybdenum cofactor guanylyltransferase MobA n=1 Tax=Emcibacter sp. SYSU 3D8 TaxID=3133969 RepID=UPI0031FEB01C
MENTATSGVLGVILAGGLSRRMGGGDKGLLPLGGKPVLCHVIDRVMPQVDRLVLNANGDPNRWKRFALPVIGDTVEGYPGPLAGLLAGMDWAAAQALPAGWILTVPCDSPFLPRDLVARLIEAAGDAPAAVASSGGRLHPVAGLFHRRLRDGLADFLAGGGRRAGDWAARTGAHTAVFEESPVDPFFNVNTPEELAAAERLGVE